MLYKNFIEKKMYTSTEVSSLPVRENINEKYKWNLTHIYKTDDEWEADFKWIEQNIPGYEKFKGTLSNSADNLFNCLDFDDSIGIKLERLFLYAMLSKDSDMRVTKYQALEERIKSLHSRAAAAGSFIKPELLQIPDEKLDEMINSKKELQAYKHIIDDLLRTKAHTLSKNEEELLALASEIVQIPYNAFSMFTMLI